MTYTLKQLPVVWDIFSYQLSDFICTDPDQFQAALKDTYEIFQKYKNEENVPKELCQIIHNMNNYIINVENADDLPIIDYSSQISNIVYAVLDGFLNETYDCDFPVIKLPKHGNEFRLFDMEKDDIFNLIEMMYDDSEKYHAAMFNKLHEKPTENK